MSEELVEKMTWQQLVSAALMGCVETVATIAVVLEGHLVLAALAASWSTIYFQVVVQTE